MIACLRTVGVPPEVRDLAWISEGRAVREAHGILAAAPAPADERETS